MNTIKVGKLFCEKFNEVNKTSLSPKEIFREHIAPLCWNGLKSLVFIKNSKFAVMFNRKIKTIEDLDIYFKPCLDEFCAEVETDDGRMTSLNTFAGCAHGGKKNSTTFFCANNNIYFSIDERYCSFIGFCFTLESNGFSIIVNNKDIIWMLYQSMLLYRDFLNKNSRFIGNQHTKWNTIYLYEMYNNGNLDNIINYWKGEKIEYKGKLNFEQILIILCKHNIKYIELYKPVTSSASVTCGQILLDLPNIESSLNLIKEIYKVNNEDFNHFDYSKTFGHALLTSSIRRGAISKNSFDPIERYKATNEPKKEQKNFVKKYIEFLMDDKTKKMATDFAKELKIAIKNNRNVLTKETTNIFEAKSKSAFNAALIAFIKCTELSPIYEEVMEYINSSISKEDFEQFKTYTNFQIIK